MSEFDRRTISCSNGSSKHAIIIRSTNYQSIETRASNENITVEVMPKCMSNNIKDKMKHMKVLHKLKQFCENPFYTKNAIKISLKDHEHDYEIIKRLIKDLEFSIEKKDYEWIYYHNWIHSYLQDFESFVPFHIKTYNTTLQAKKDLNEYITGYATARRIINQFIEIEEDIPTLDCYISGMMKIYYETIEEKKRFLRYANDRYEEDYEESTEIRRNRRILDELSEEEYEDENMFEEIDHEYEEYE